MWRFVQIYQATQYQRLALLLVFPVLLLITLKGTQMILSYTLYYL